MSKKKFSSLSCMVCKDQHCHMTEALLTGLVPDSVSAQPFGPEDSLSEAQKRCKGCIYFFSCPVAEGTRCKEPPQASRGSSLVWSSPSQTRASLNLGRVAATLPSAQCPGLSHSNLEPRCIDQCS